MNEVEFLDCAVEVSPAEVAEAEGEQGSAAAEALLKRVEVDRKIRCGRR
jgi:hypothetical protein